MVELEGDYITAMFFIQASTAGEEQLSTFVFRKRKDACEHFRTATYARVHMSVYVYRYQLMNLISVLYIHVHIGASA